MMGENGIRLFEELMRFKPPDLTANGWAVKAGISRAFWNDLKRHGNPSRRTLEKLLAAAGSSLAEFEALRADGPPAQAASRTSGFGEPGPGWRPAFPAPLSVVATAPGGEWGRPGSQIDMLGIQPGAIIDQLVRPASLAADADAYAVTVIGDSMWPRFRPGRRLAVSPAAPVGIGDDVVVVIRRGREAPVSGKIVLIKELVRRSQEAIELRQFNPDLTFRVESFEVDAIHRIMGEIF